MKVYYIMSIIVILCSCQKENRNKMKLDNESGKKEINEKKENLSSLNTSRRLLELTDLEFKTKVIDLGNIIEGDSVVRANYVFKNSGDKDLLIEYVNPDCTCTDYDFSKDTIPSGKEGFVELTYNIKDKIGSQKLYAVMKANTEAQFYKLIFKLNILENK